MHFQGKLSCQSQQNRVGPSKYKIKMPYFILKVLKNKLDLQKWGKIHVKQLVGPEVLPLTGQIDNHTYV